ncbi:sulfate/molybdate ABC transporter ATP-binding protein [Halosimplex carlsbadense 2-9-1]|uniref:Molybdate/tungstate import ATP-binding protein WtpC n=1 Tax=Halosimplex carlsbadense 2-9-1 TaxID=797114 RepID=M0D1C7_9EURY|nr:ABC transporter ATP-binding protein [Halosimplex carlsbadense]ELZ29245.1 sulfate/molybdate ABC transporter ATP-binding protein [Halosimplex carlsbadense 2-9-1]
MATITLDSVTKRFGETTAVDGVDLTVGDGEILGVVGPSGCGKTTTLRTIAGFETPTEGRVLFDEEDVTRVPPERRSVGLVFQSYALFENMTVRENVQFGPKMRGVSKPERRERATELLELLDIAELADRDPTTLSGGQQQRVGLARALAIEPTILLLDEPMTGLDAKLKTRLQRELVELLDELAVTALYVTHDQTEAMAVCDRIAVMNDGRVEQVGTPDEVYERPANAFVADFVGTSNRLRATARNGTLDFGHATTAAPNGDDGEVTVVVRPEAFRVGDGSFEATVRERFYLGEHVRAVADLPDGESVTLRVDPAEAPATGDRVSLALDTDRVHVLSEP